ncbi:hypothetical protein ACFFSH_13660 [Streptomyces filamentosus]|uniref:Uncharacterized protein n=1 Tax=Streptomyces filamentosus TaxID=67294 RepID=A0A919ETI4_STRFL|nr:hypothetical protein [Streptomyces filamentosus]GHG27955.1 hypothetical protein GCM10017667_76180 [Streptomyces filamentosus]
MTDDPHDAWTRIPSSSGPGTAPDRAREFVRDLCAHARSYPGAERAEADFEREE